MLQTADNPGQSAGSFDAEGTMLERLTIAIVAVLLVAALVLAIRYDIERTAAMKPSAHSRDAKAARGVDGLAFQHRQDNGASMRTELVTISTDTLPLDGAFCEPDGGATAGAVLLLHRNTMNFVSTAFQASSFTRTR
jgi:hypothetical protein